MEPIQVGYGNRLVKKNSALLKQSGALSSQLTQLCEVEPAKG